MREGEGSHAFDERGHHEHADDSQSLCQPRGELRGDEAAGEEAELHAADLDQREALEQQVLNEQEREDAREVTANYAAHKDDAVVQVVPTLHHNINITKNDNYQFPMACSQIP